MCILKPSFSLLFLEHGYLAQFSWYKLKIFWLIFLTYYSRFLKMKLGLKGGKFRQTGSSGIIILQGQGSHQRMRFCLVRGIYVRNRDQWLSPLGQRPMVLGGCLRPKNPHPVNRKCLDEANRVGEMGRRAPTPWG